MVTEACITLQRLITCSHSAGETLTRSATFHALTQTSDRQEQEDGLPQQRRTTIGEPSVIIRIMEWLFYVIVLLWRIHNSSSLFFMPFMQHHMCLSPRIRMETSLWRYCKPSKRGLQGGITHSPELLQLHNMLCLYFSAPLIYQSNDSANRLRILVPVQDLASKIARILSDQCVSWNTKRRACPVFNDPRHLSITSHWNPAGEAQIRQNRWKRWLTACGVDKL